MKRLQRFLVLTPAGRGMFLLSLLLLPAVAVLLKLRGMALTQASLDRLGRRSEHDHGTLAPQEIARLVDAASSILGTCCLPRSLLLCHLLRNRGIQTKLRLGVSRLADGSLSAHAWVELGGVPLNDSARVFEHYGLLRACAPHTYGGRRY